MVFYIDENGKKRNAKYIRKVSNEEMDQHGKIHVREYVEVMNIGKNFNWKNFIPMKIFLKNNPRKKINTYKKVEYKLNNEIIETVKNEQRKN